MPMPAMFRYGVRRTFTLATVAGMAAALLAGCGYLDGARALAGYVLDRSGQRWVFVFLMNDPKSRQGKAAMDALLRWVAEQ